MRTFEQSVHPKTNTDVPKHKKTHTNNWHYEKYQTRRGKNTKSAGRSPEEVVVHLFHHHLLPVSMMIELAVLLTYWALL